MSWIQIEKKRESKLQLITIGTRSIYFSSAFISAYNLNEQKSVRLFISGNMLGITFDKEKKGINSFNLGKKGKIGKYIGIPKDIAPYLKPKKYENWSVQKNGSDNMFVLNLR